MSGGGSSVHFGSGVGRAFIESLKEMYTEKEINQDQFTQGIQAFDKVSIGGFLHTQCASRSIVFTLSPLEPPVVLSDSPASRSVVPHMLSSPPSLRSSTRC